MVRGSEEYLELRLPRWHSGKESACQCRRPGFDPWVGKISWKRKWQPTPKFLPGDFHGQKSLTEYSPWGHKESDTTEGACTIISNFLEMLREDIGPRIIWG